MNDDRNRRERETKKDLKERDREIVILLKKEEMRSVEGKGREVEEGMGVWWIMQMMEKVRGGERRNVE